MNGRSLTDSLRETLALFDACGPPQTTIEVADRLDLGRRSTYERLERLVDRGELETKKAGSNGRVWWRPHQTTGTHAVDVGEWSTITESLIDDVLNDAAVGVFVLDEEFNVAWVNDTLQRYFGLDREHVLGRDKRALVRDRIAPVVDDGERLTETVLATYEENTHAERFECRVTAGEGREARWLEHRSKPVETGTYAGGRVELYYDITEQKRSERARREEKTQLESLVDAVEEYGIFMLDADGYVRSWNAGAEQIKGYAAEDVRGEHVSTFYSEADREAGVPESNLATAAEEGSIEDQGWRVRADGSRFWANMTITAIRDDDGDLKGYAKVTRDMTDRREWERRLRRERDLTKRLIETAPVRLAIFGADGSLERMNSAARRELDIDESSATASDFTDMNPSDVEGRPISSEDHPVWHVIETGEPVSDRLVQHETPDGRQRWVSLTAAPLFDDEGTLERIIVAGKDVTELKRKERQLERRRDELRHELDEVYERVTDAFLAVDTDLRFTHLNDHAEELLGTTEENVYGEYLWNSFPEVTERSFKAQYERAMTTQEPVSFEEYSDTAAAWFEVRAYPSATGLSIYFTDITERKERERKLKQYEQLVETVWDGVYALDENDRFVLVNQAFCDLVGYDRDELLGEHATLINSETVNETANELETEISAGEREVGVLEYEFERADGESVPVETRFGPYEYDGDRTGRCGVARDISVRKEYEREIKESNERLEQFAYVASHDLQEPLRMVTSYLQLLENRYGDTFDEDGEEFLAYATDGAERMREMIDGLLEYSRVSTRGDPFEPVDLNDVLDDVIADLQLQIEETNAEITVEDLPRVEGDASQLRQVFQNLLDNAITYSGDEPPRVHITADRHRGEWEISLEDDGIGIDPDDQERIFTIFDRLHSREEYDGTGIGLALCQRIVERHDGEISVDSEPGAGATFSFTLPT